ncbi:hypothetical protein EJ05DRAFT_430567, partial [Pseudovirgaria hyperparasitica]
LWRYVRFLRHIQLWLQRKPIPLPQDPKYKPQDATVLIPTICDNTEMLEVTIQKCALSRPSQIILVGVTNRKVLDPLVEKYVDEFRDHYGTSLKVLYSKEANKRKQVAIGIKQIASSITVLVDDDVIWPDRLLHHLLAPLDNPTVGAAGTLQQVQLRPGLTLPEQLFEILGSFYIQRRNVEITATTAIDGGTSCLSGRTAAVRTGILADPAFLAGYTAETWRGRILRADDDNFVTRWLYKRGWQIRVQVAPEAVVRTYQEVSPRFLKQCLRWVRSTWRSNYTTLVYDGDVWMKQPWSTYALYTQVPFPSILIDPLLLWLLLGATSPSTGTYTTSTVFLLWLALTKTAKFTPLYRRHPRWLLFLPATLLFGYVHAFIRFYALCTLSDTGWASRPLIDAP